MKYINNIVNKYKSFPIAVKASAIYFIVSLVQKGLGFITSPIYTRILTSAEYGQVSVYFSYEQLIGTIAMFCLNAGCFDVGMQIYKEERRTFVSSMLFLSNCITIIIIILCFLLYPIVDSYISIPPRLLIVMFISFLFQPALTFWTRHERYEYRYKKSALVTVILAVMSSIFAIAFIIFLNGNNVTERIIGGMIPSMIIYLFFYLYDWKRANPKIKFEYVKFAFLFNLPLIPHYLSTYILNSSDRLMISNIRGDSEAGYYSLAYSLAAIILLIWNSINSSLTPYVMDKYEKKRFNDVSKVIYPILLIFVSFCMMIVLLAPEILALLGTREYKIAVYVIPPIAGGVFFQALYYVFTDLLYYYKKQKFVLLASIISAVMNIILNYFLIPRYGFIAAGYTTLVCYLLQAIIDFFVSYYIIKVSLVKPKHLLMMIIIVVLLIVVSNILYQFIYIRFCVICCGIIFMLALKDRIKKYISPNKLSLQEE